MTVPGEDPLAALPVSLRVFRVRQWADDPQAREPAPDSAAEWTPAERAFVYGWCRWARSVRRWLNARPQVDTETVWRALFPESDDDGGGRS
ncbi:hypothetical protein SAMN05660657_04300 [Geodermatophilus amargosae]|uniref:Uncharacterized protein n=1 Tax=Geodermatophilus amargosae TaxID=1296565 RepID=A0A1I7CBX6_9ACTN|nr:hypothetical protein [Geodermatophilus amargosae]SFT96935.1 hypothetical protein SAMN05660657_04300 [Geodermatophilus amargosae]